MMKTYKDFIGTTITTNIRLFEYASAEAALNAELRTRISKQLDYSNGLICSFINIQAAGDKDHIYISGKITECEVNC